MTGALDHPDGFHGAVFQYHERDGYRTLPTHAPGGVGVFEVLDDQIADIAEIVGQIFLLFPIPAIGHAVTRGGTRIAFD